ncbi:MAG: C69 family dipeptidase [Sedimentisphaerales bacterium]|nr:C69 family dipeptidase [Sedimentisphaerales bacterium]
MNMLRKKTFAGLLPVAIVFILCLTVAASRCEGCFSIVAGKNVSMDGHVIVGHNEDNSPPQIVNHHKIPRIKHSSTETVRLLNGGQLSQVEQTWAYIWSEMPGVLFSDGYINEWGVCITSDNCPSREDKPEITGGGIGYMLRRLIAERARTAREGVLFAGSLVERFGYIDSGRTYIICDPDEGWLFCVVNGKHWLAQRVPDDEVAMVANTYTIRQVDLSDSDNFLGSKNIIDYAVYRGWYNPKEGKPFDFSAAYANPMSASSFSNFGRQWTGFRYISAVSIPPSPELPFSVVPKGKVGAAEIMQILRHDHEGMDIQSLSLLKIPQESGCPICRSSTQTSFVTQLRRTMPLDIGIVYWTCLAQSRTSFYIPFHFGISEFPAGFSSDSQRPSKTYFDNMIARPFRADPLHAFWMFSNFCNKMQGASADTINRAKEFTEVIEGNAFTLQNPLEEAAQRLYTNDKDAAMRMLANYSNGIYLSSVEAMHRVLSER